MSWVPCAGHARYDGCQGVVALPRMQGSCAIWQVHAAGEHGVNGLKVPAVLQWLRCDPHLVVEGAFQHRHGDSAGGLSRWRLRVCPRTHRLHVAIHHRLEVVPPLAGCPAFPVREAILRWDVKGRQCSVAALLVSGLQVLVQVGVRLAGR